MARMFQRHGRRDENAAAALIGVIIGIAIFTIGFYYLTQSAVERDADTTTADQASLEQTAASLADLLFSAGAGWYGNDDACIVVDGESQVDDSLFDAEGVERFGIGEELCQFETMSPGARKNISYDKILNLYYAGSDADATNGYVDYDEARASLGLDERFLDFHLRSWPVLASVRELLQNGQKDPNMKALYIADYVGSQEVEKRVQHSISMVDASDRVTLRLSITNNGTEATIFATQYDIPLSKKTIDFTMHTPLLAPNENYVVEVVLRKTSDWSWDSPANRKVSYVISDKNEEVGSGTYDLSAITMTRLGTYTNVFAEADQMYWVMDGLTESLKINYLAFEGDGDKVRFSDWTLWTTDPLGLPLPAVVLPNNSDGGVATVTTTQIGTHLGILKNDLLTVTWNQDVLNVVDEEVSEFTTAGASEYLPGTPVADELYFIDLLAENFDAAPFDILYDSVDVPYVAGGDAYPDIKDVMNNDLVDALTDENGDPDYSEYTMLIVGSNVDHQSMTSAAAKNNIRDWVLGGGTLLVYGSDDQSVQWLQPLFHSSLETGSTGLSTPDEDHPVLHTPNDLDYPAYDYETQWDYNADADEAFTHVVKTDGGDLMAVSDPGAFGDGRVLLSGWRPYDLTSDQAEACAAPISYTDKCEALYLIHNMMTLSYRYLFLDYGPSIPLDAGVGTQMRLLNVYHPELREVVQLQLQVYTFRGG